MKKWRTFLRLILLTFTIILSSNFSNAHFLSKPEPSLTPKEILSGEIQKKDRFVDKTEIKSVTERRFGEKNTPLESFWKNNSCESIFAPLPWPGMRKLATEDIEGNWVPFCTASFIFHTWSSTSPNITIGNVDHGYRAQGFFDSTCFKDVMLEVEPNKQVTTREQRAKPEEKYSLQEANQLLLEAKVFKKQVTNVCCSFGEIEKCKQAFEDMTINWCSNIENIGPTDNCANGAFFSHSSKSIYLSRRKDRKPTAHVFLHELGHGCSTIQGAHHYKENNCKISNESLSKYATLYKNLGASQETIDCLLNRSIQSAKSCNGCELSYMEEGLADWISIAAGKERDLVTVATQICKGALDSQHLGNALSMQCFLKTPSFVERLSKSIGCKQ